MPLVETLRQAGGGPQLSAAPLRKPRRLENRPRSSKLFSCQGAYPEPLSSYAEDFGPKSLLNTHYVCSGSASGNRRNNPHPAEAFMVWRVSHFPPLKKDLISPSTSGFLKGRQLTPQLSVIMKSTYQDDYLGAQQGLHQNTTPHSTATPLPSRAIKSLITSTRRAYQVPRLTTSLTGNTTRYGCSVDIVRPAYGIMPNLPPSCIKVSYKTNYKEDFGPEDSQEGEEFERHPRRALPRLPLPPITMTMRPSFARGNRSERRKVGRAGKNALSQVEHVRADFVDLGMHKLPTWLSHWCGPL